MWSNMVYLYPYIPHKKWLYIGLVALTFECFTPVLAMLYNRQLIDRVFIHGQVEQFIPLLVLFLVFFFAPKLFFTIRKIIYFEMGYQLQESLMREYLQKVYRLSTGTFQKETGAKLLHNLKTDVSSASDTFVNSILSETLFSVLSLLFLTGALAMVSVPILIGTSGVAVLYYTLHKRFSKLTKQLAKQVQREKANLSANMEESISSVRETIAFNGQKLRQIAYQKHYQNYYESLFKQGMHTIKATIVSEPLLYITKLLFIFFGILLVMNKQMSLGTFVVSYTLTEQLVTVIGQLFQLGMAQKRLEPHVTALKRILEENEDEFGTQGISGDIKSIYFRNISFDYEKHEGSHNWKESIFKDFSLDLPVGKKIAFIGESGCGKSTLARLLLRQLKPQAGEILINGVNIADFGQTFTDKVSMVSQQPLFLPLTVKENLTLGRDYLTLDLEKVCKAMKCYDFIMGLPQGFDTLIGERGANLSGGEKQRLALARVLLINPELLVLDEATSAMDLETEYHIQQNLDQFRAGKTTIIIAHRNTAIANCDVTVAI